MASTEHQEPARTRPGSVFSPVSLIKDIATAHRCFAEHAKRLRVTEIVYYGPEDLALCNKADGRVVLEFSLSTGVLAAPANFVPRCEVVPLLLRVHRFGLWPPLLPLREGG